MKIDYKEVAPGMIRITPSMEGIITAERYVEIARNLLANGLSPNDEKLKDESSMDLADSLSLFMEFKPKIKEVKQVVFSMYGKDYIVNLNNIDTIFSKKNEASFNENIRLAKEVIQEINENII